MIKLADQYAIPSLWRYCEANIDKKFPTFPKNQQGDKDWAQALRLYACMNTDRVDFVIDYLLEKRKIYFASKEQYMRTLKKLTPDDALSAQEQQNVSDRLLGRLDTLFDNIEVVREEHEDRIIGSIDILEQLALRLSNDQPSFTSYMSCSSINTALSTLFKATIAKQFADDESEKDRIIAALTTIHLKQAKLTMNNTWQPIEWDAAEANGIASLTASLLNYLTQAIPDEIKRLSYWHHESLVLAFNDSLGKKIPLSTSVINFAEHAVTQCSERGFYFLLRPSSRAASSKNAMIFTMTANMKLSVMQNHFVDHCRIEAIRDEKNQKWLFKMANSQDLGVSIDKFIAKQARGLPIIPINMPKTSKQRVNVYVSIAGSPIQTNL